MTETHFDAPNDLVIFGTALRTSAKTAAEDIPAFWQRFMRDGLAARLPRRSDDDGVYAVYCDYESDHGGAYTMVLGVAVDAGAEVPAGVRRVRVPKGRYARFRAEGDPAQVVWQTWAHVNEQWIGRRERRYIADFERYDPRAMGSGSVRAEIVVGLV
jgi:predicted transcriptional regulator YdeE